MNVSSVVNKSIELYNDDKFEGSYNLLKKLLNKNIDFNTLSIIYYNMGLCKYSLKSYKDAQRCYLKSISLGFECQYELFLTLLQMGDLDEGSKYWYSRCEGTRKSYPNLPLPRLKFNMDSKSILVLNEQGFGDELLFSRQIKYLSSKYEKVSYQVYEENLELFNQYFKFDNVTFFTDRNLKYEFVIEHNHFLMSGDFLFNLINENYIIESNSDIKYDIGFCWSANSKSKNTKERSIDPYLLTEKFKDKKVLSLQWNEKLEFTDYEPINNLLDTANNILKCDEIWTIDTVVAHLALILGKKVNLLYKDYLDWRWVNNLYKDINFIKV